MEIEYDGNGRMIERRSSKQNRYIRAFICDVVNWHEKHIHFRKYNKNMSKFQKRYAHNYYHEFLKKNVLEKEFNINSTRNLSKQQCEEYVASCIVFLAEKKINIYE